MEAMLAAKLAADAKRRESSTESDDLTFSGDAAEMKKQLDDILQKIGKDSKQRVLDLVSAYIKAANDNSNIADVGLGGVTVGAPIAAPAAVAPAAGPPPAAGPGGSADPKFAEKAGPPQPPPALA